MKLLFADDERELNDAVSKILKLNKYDVDSVFDGEEALDYLRAGINYDGVILDVMMPVLDGISVVKRMRAEKINTPVLLLTARSETDDKVSGLDAGADDYLTKPFSVKELLARIRALTRRKGDVTDSFSLGNMTLNAGTSEVTAKTTVRLTNKEYKLLEYLVRNKNVLLSTDKIMETVWDLDSDSEINTVWVYISAVRKKLEAAGADHTIKAVRGVGYRLEKI